MKRNSAEVIQAIETIVSEHMGDYLVSAEYIGQIEFTRKDFPKLFMFENEAAIIQRNVNSFGLNVRLLDVAESLNNKQRKDYEVKSDMKTAGSILIDYLKAEDIIVSSDDISMNPITITGGDGLSGVEIDLVIPLEKACVVVQTPTGNDPRYNFRALTIGKPITNATAITIDLTELTFNESGLDGSIVSAEAEDEELNVTINAEKTEITIQTDDLSPRFSNVAFKVTNGFVSSSAVIVVTVTESIIKEGIGYRVGNMWSGQSTSYDVGDEGYLYQAGFFEDNNPVNPLYFATLDKDATNPFITLVNNNYFGNKDRFTDINGLQIYGDDYVIDNYTGLGWYRVESFFAGYPNTYEVEIATVEALTLNGYSDWHICPATVLDSIVYMEALMNVINYTPFNIGGLVVRTSTTSNSSVRTSVLNLGSNILSYAEKSNPNAWSLIFRRHF